MPVLKGTRLQGSRFGYKSDPLFQNTTLLLSGVGTNGANNNVFVDASTNNFAITRNGNTTQGTFSPFSQTGWSNYFDGSGDYLSVPDNSVFAMGSGNFTIECWVFRTTTGARTFIYGQSDGISINNSSVSSEVSATNKLNTYVAVGATEYTATATNDFPSNQWVYVAIVRNGGTISQYINGFLDGQYTSLSTSSINDSPIIFGIGSLGTYSTAWWNGYISNFRVTKGGALYTSNFTPSTTPLTTTVSAGTVSLLTCQSNRFIDNSTNNFAITRNGDTRVVAFSPFAPTAEYTPSIHGGSGYFDGTGDYLSLATGIPIPTSGTFTIEAWVYPTDTTEEAIWTQYSAGTSGRSSFRIVSGKLTFANSSASTVTSVASVLTNTWTHVAVVRDSSNNLLLFINGALDTTVSSYTASIQQIAATIGSFLSDSSAVFSGYVSSLRTTSTAVYTVAFTPPTAPLTAIANTSLLLNFTNAGIYDATGKNNLETVGDAKISTAQSKFGNSSMLFDGTGDYLLSSAPLSELAFLHNGTPWTVEGWFFTGSTSQQFILSTDTASVTTGFGISINDFSTRDLDVFIFRGVSGSYLAAISSTNVWSLNTWTHFVATLDASKNLSVFINGTQVVTTSGSSFSFSSSNPSFSLAVGRAQQASPVGYFNGYIADLRVTRGIARYTANFTPQVSLLALR